MKQKIAFLLLFASALLLTACGTAGGVQRDWDENTLVYAKLGVAGLNQADVDAFNEAHTDVQIELRVYWGDTREEIQQSSECLLVEMAAGKIPDIIDFGGVDLQKFPYQQLARKEYFEDLWPYIENDPELGREGVLEAPLKAAEIDGGLYMIFNRVDITTLIGAESLVGDRNSWTLRDLQTAFSGMPEDSTVMEYYYTKNRVCETILPMMLDSYIDWESGQWSFDDATFREALEFINTFPDETAWDGFGRDEVGFAELTERLLDGRQMLMSMWISSPGDIRRYDALFGGRCAFVGFPVEDGSTGSCFEPRGEMVAITSACRNKDAAWEFVRQCLLPKKMDDLDLQYSIPVNLTNYNQVIRALRGKKKGTLSFQYYNSPRIDLSPMTVEEVQRFEDFFNSIDKIGICDADVYDIVVEQCGAYFAGDKTLDETIRLINNRVKLYVNEQK